MTLNRFGLIEESYLEGTFQVIPCSSLGSRIGCTSEASVASRWTGIAGAASPASRDFRFALKDH